MVRIQWITGAIPATDPIALPAWAPRLETVVSAEITRIPSALAPHTPASVIVGVAAHDDEAVILGVVDHPAADVIAGVTDHAAALGAGGVAAHAELEVIACMNAHPVHTHSIAVGAAVVVTPYGATGAGALDIVDGAGQNLPGAPAATGLRNNAAVQAHIATAVNLGHNAGAAVGHVAGAAVAHNNGVAVEHTAGVPVVHAGADPVVASGLITKIDQVTISLDTVNLLVGDLFTLNYLEVGEQIMVS